MNPVVVTLAVLATIAMVFLMAVALRTPRGPGAWPIMKATGAPGTVFFGFGFGVLMSSMLLRVMGQALDVWAHLALTMLGSLALVIYYVLALLQRAQQRGMQLPTPAHPPGGR